MQILPRGHKYFRACESTFWQQQSSVLNALKISYVMYVCECGCCFVPSLCVNVWQLVWCQYQLVDPALSDCSFRRRVFMRIRFGRLPRFVHHHVFFVKQHKFFLFKDPTGYLMLNLYVLITVWKKKPHTHKHTNSYHQLFLLKQWFIAVAVLLHTHHSLNVILTPAFSLLPHIALPLICEFQT